jgi:hypothetical protein
MASRAALSHPASVTDASHGDDNRSSARLILTALAAAVAAFGLFGAVGLERFLKQPMPARAAATTVDAAPLARLSAPVGIQRPFARQLRRPVSTRSATALRRSVGAAPTASAVPASPSEPSQGATGPESSPRSPDGPPTAAPDAGAPAPVAEPPTSATPLPSIDLPPVVEVDVPALPALPLLPVTVPDEVPPVPSVTTPVLP